VASAQRGYVVWGYERVHLTDSDHQKKEDKRKKGEKYLKNGSRKKGGDGQESAELRKIDRKEEEWKCRGDLAGRLGRLIRRAAKT